MNNENAVSSLKQKKSVLATHKDNAPENFNPIVGQPYNIDKVTLEQIDNLNITYIFTTGRSASTLLGVMLMMHEQVIFTSEEVFPVILKQKYCSVKKWTKQVIKEYCDDFVLMSEGKLYPLFCGKDVLFQLLMKFADDLNYERVIRISYLAFGINKDLSKITTIVDKQLRYYLSHYYLQLFPVAKVLLLVRDPRDNVYSKYNRALRKKIETNTCLYIHTWTEAFNTYFKILEKYKNPYYIINYENLIGDSENTMQKISEFLSINYTEQFFKYPEIISVFFDNISYPALKEHFTITHKSLMQPINPQKINAWTKHLDNPEISHVINATWYHTKSLSEKMNYKPHENYQQEKLNCIKQYLKVKMSFISSNLYFNYLPYFLKKIIKKLKYPYRLSASSTYDKFLRKGYL